MLGEEAEQSGETAAAAYIEYEEVVLGGLREEYGLWIERSAGRIRTATSTSNAQNMRLWAQIYLPGWRRDILTLLRTEYGSRSSHADRLVNEVNETLRPRLASLREDGQRDQ